jgi:hypothetical protein
MERFWNAAVATNDNCWRPEQDRNAHQRDQWRLTAINGKARRPTVTPEVAGSSPVAPVKILANQLFLLPT